MNNTTQQIVNKAWNFAHVLRDLRKAPSPAFWLSMSRRGDCWDNAVMESFFSTLKIERTNRTKYKTRDQARADIFDYIERFYHVLRRHSTLGQISPVEFERRYAC